MQYPFRPLEMKPASLSLFAPLPPEYINGSPELADVFLQLLDPALQVLIRERDIAGDQHRRVLQIGLQVLLDQGLGFFERQTFEIHPAVVDAQGDLAACFNQEDSIYRGVR